MESTKNIQKIIETIRKKGVRACVALNPATPLCYLDYLYDEIDMILIMTVNPGFSGQKLIPATLKKIEDLRAHLDLSLIHI